MFKNYDEENPDRLLESPVSRMLQEEAKRLDREIRKNLEIMKIATQMNSEKENTSRED